MLFGRSYQSLAEVHSLGQALGVDLPTLLAEAEQFPARPLSLGLGDLQIAVRSIRLRSRTGCTVQAQENSVVVQVEGSAVVDAEDSEPYHLM